MTNGSDSETNGAEGECERRGMVGTTALPSSSLLSALGLIGLASLAIFFLVTNAAMLRRCSI